MTKKIQILFLSLVAALSLDAAEELPPTIQTHLKLMVLNDADEMLLVKFQGIWEPAGKRYRESLSLTEVVKLMGRELGVQVDNVQLRALTTYFYRDSNRPTTFAFYTAKYKGGTPEIPAGCQDIGWFPLSEAADKIDLKEMSLIAQHVAAGNQNVLSGAFRIYKTPNSRKIEIVEPLR